MLREAVDVFGQTVVMVTHDPVAAAHADTVIFLADGAVVDHLRQPTAGTVAERMTHLDSLVTRRAAPSTAGAADGVR